MFGVGRAALHARQVRDQVRIDEILQHADQPSLDEFHIVLGMTVLAARLFRLERWIPAEVNIGRGEAPTARVVVDEQGGCELLPRALGRKLFDSNELQQHSSEGGRRVHVLLVEPVKAGHHLDECQRRRPELLPGQVRPSQDRKLVVGVVDGTDVGVYVLRHLQESLHEFGKTGRFEPLVLPDAVLQAGLPGQVHKLGQGREGRLTDRCRQIVDVDEHMPELRLFDRRRHRPVNLLVVQELGSGRKRPGRL
mmetsp:Transcript_987/g.2981  ORF Transcript_987/g.2981 Transcript_987/m.2981 type:complete len:251 (+) Transcript_987:162-914(+)